MGCGDLKSPLKEIGLRLVLMQGNEHDWWRGTRGRKRNQQAGDFVLSLPVKQPAGVFRLKQLNGHNYLSPGKCHILKANFKVDESLSICKIQEICLINLAFISVKHKSFEFLSLTKGGLAEALWCFASFNVGKHFVFQFFLHDFWDAGK